MPGQNRIAGLSASHRINRATKGSQVGIGSKVLIRSPHRSGEPRILGIGFALEPRSAVTAAHVVQGHEAVSLAFVASDTAVPASVINVDRDENLDVAVLQLASDVAPVFSVGPGVAGSEWRVDTQPSPSDPGLTGDLTFANKKLVNSRGREMRVHQLHVRQDLKDFQGYSGSPVQASNGAVLGVLIEQSLVRAHIRGLEFRQAANVLFATPIDDVVTRFQMNPSWMKAPLTKALERRLSSAVERAAAVGNHIQDIRAEVTSPLGFDLEQISRVILQRMTFSEDGPSFLKGIPRQDVTQEVSDYIAKVEEAWIAVRIAKMDDEHGAEAAELMHEPINAVQCYQTALSNFIWAAEKELD